MRILTLIFLSLFSLKLKAHPVSFQDSIGVMGSHSDFLSHNQINYSLRHWMALGIHHINRPQLKSNKSASFITSNFLLKRWNGDALQANLYGVLGVGSSDFYEKNTLSGFSMLQFDIENRKYYFLLKHLRVYNEERTDFYQTSLRLGLSPYQDEYGGFHSWLILEIQNINFFNERSLNDITPFLRFFYRNLLFEIGQSFDGVTKFNYITHF